MQDANRINQTKKYYRALQKISPMIRKSTINLQHLFTDNKHGLANLYRHWHYQRQLAVEVDRIIKQQISRTALPYVVGQYKKYRLTIYVADHSQGQFLHNQQYSIVQQLRTRAAFHDLERLRIAVDPDMFPPPAKRSVMVRQGTDRIKIVRKKAQRIRSLAAQVQDSRLAKRLQHLADTMERMPAVQVTHASTSG